MGAWGRSIELVLIVVRQTFRTAAAERAPRGPLVKFLQLPSCEQLNFDNFATTPADSQSASSPLWVEISISRSHGTRCLCPIRSGCTKKNRRHSRSASAHKSESRNCSKRGRLKSYRRCRRQQVGLENKSELIGCILGRRPDKQARQKRWKAISWARGESIRWSKATRTRIWRKQQTRAASWHCRTRILHETQPTRFGKTLCWRSRNRSRPLTKR